MVPQESSLPRAQNEACSSAAEIQTMPEHAVQPYGLSIRVAKATEDAAVVRGEDEDSVPLTSGTQYSSLHGSVFVLRLGLTTSHSSLFRMQIRGCPREQHDETVQCTRLDRWRAGPLHAPRREEKRVFRTARQCGKEVHVLSLGSSRGGRGPVLN